MLGLVYKIIHNQSNWCYVGSTFNELRYRWQDHKLAFSKWCENKEHNKTSCFDKFLEFGIENFKIILIKYYEVVDRLHLEMYETLWINKLKSCNRNVPFQIKYIYNIWYRKTHKKEISERDKKYRINNIEKLNKKNSEYRELHKEELNKKERERYQKNKDYIREKIKCDECDIVVSRSSMKRHKKRWHQSEIKIIYKK